MHDLVVIGGGEAGFIAALTAKKTNKEANITLIADDNQFYSPCALPFVISGELELDAIIDDLREMCGESNINCVIDTATSIDTENNKVNTESGKEFEYTSLIIATGGLPCVPPIPGKDLEGVYTLKTVEDTKKILKRIETAKKAVVIGGGAIGVEASAALAKKNLEVTLVERCEHILARALDPEFSQTIENELKKNGINLLLNSCVDKILGDSEVKGVKGVKIGEKEIEADIVIMGLGVIPNIGLAKDAGIEIFGRGIKTDGWMQTNIKNIYAAGDCVDSRSISTGKLMMSQLATTALRHGMTAGANAVGGYATFEGVLNSMILKIFDTEIGRTGLTECDAEENDTETITGIARGTTKSDYFPGTKNIRIKLVFNELDREIIGAQVIGGEAVAGKIDIIAFAIANHSEIEDLMKLKYCYTPPSSPPRNLIVMAAENAFRKLDRDKENRKRQF